MHVRIIASKDPLFGTECKVRRKDDLGYTIELPEGVSHPINPSRIFWYRADVLEVIDHSAIVPLPEPQKPSWAQKSDWRTTPEGQDFWRRVEALKQTPVWDIISDGLKRGHFNPVVNGSQPRMFSTLERYERQVPGSQYRLL